MATLAIHNARVIDPALGRVGLTEREAVARV